MSTTASTKRYSYSYKSIFMRLNHLSIFHCTFWLVCSLYIFFFIHYHLLILQSSAIVGLIQRFFAIPDIQVASHIITILSTLIITVSLRSISCLLDNWIVKPFAKCSICKSISSFLNKIPLYVSVPVGCIILLLLLKLSSMGLALLSELNSSAVSLQSTSSVWQHFLYFSLHICPTALQHAAFLLCICILLHSKNKTSSQALNYTIIFLQLFLFAYSIWLCVTAVYTFYTDTVCFKETWESFLKFLPHQHIAASEIGWISLVSSFVTGSMIVISWSKDNPCTKWNPFSAKELHILDKMPFITLALWVFVCWATIYNAHRLQMISGILLICNNISISLSCYHFQNDEMVRHKVLYKLQPQKIYRLLRRIPFDITDPTNNSDSSLENAASLTSFLEDMQQISTYIIDHISSYNARKQVRYMTELLNELMLPLKSCPKGETFAFFMGIGCVPDKLNLKEDSILDHLYYINQIIIETHTIWNSPNSKIYYYWMVGLFIGYKNLLHKYLHHDRNTASLISENFSRIETQIDTLADQSIDIEHQHIQETYYRIMMCIDPVSLIATHPHITCAAFDNPFLYRILGQLRQ